MIGMPTPTVSPAPRTVAAEKLRRGRSVRNSLAMTVRRPAESTAVAVTREVWDGASAQRVRQLREPGAYDPATASPAPVLPATGFPVTGRTLTPVSLPSRTATRTPRSGRRSTGTAAPSEALERPLTARTTLTW